MSNTLFELKKEDKYILLKILVAKIDASNALELKQVFLGFKEDQMPRNLVLNISEVRYIDSSGLSAVLVANKVCVEAGGIMILAGVSDHVMKLVRISQLDKILDILPTEEEAIDAVFIKELEKEFGAEDEAI
ncbi:MAG: STAS domain-containing protein [Chloroflexia bacterium]|nr:STAS domain-containing protein [Chloroflexia bacterium]